MTREKSAAAPAVIILGQLNGLGIVRSLGCAGVRSHVVDTNCSAPALWSRHARPVIVPKLEGERLVRALLSLRGRFKTAPVLFNTHELAVITISRYRSCLAEAYRFRLPEHETLLALQDKGRFHALGKRLGLPIPDGVIVGASSDLAELARLRFPIVLKPTNKRHVHAARMPGPLLCDRLDTALAHCRHYLLAGIDLIAQSWIDGDSDQIYFCLFYCGGNDDVVAMFTGRKLASSPPAGTTAYCIAAPEAAPELEKMTRAFIREVGYAGMGGLEFKWDRSLGRFLIVEPTVGRTDLQHEVATLSGVNITLMGYRHELGQAPAPAGPTRADIVWRASLAEPLKGVRVRLPPSARLRDGYWRGADPLPALAHYTWGSALRVGARLGQLRPARPVPVTATSIPSEF